MRYINEYKEHDHKRMVDDINDICLELSDNGFYSYANGHKSSVVKLDPASGMFRETNSVIGICRDEIFYFSEISDILYRIKDLVGIDKIGTFNYQLVGNDSYTRCDMKMLNNETLNIVDFLQGAFITFEFPINYAKI